jgi:hypothetical protein
VETLLARRAGGGYAVLLDTATWDPSGTAGQAEATAAALRRMGWHVAVATASSHPDRVWDDLIAGSRVAPR